jgi:hypothetical protein
MVSKIIGISVSDSRNTQRQTCIFELENGKNVAMENDKIFELTSVRPNELEVFVGSQLKLSEDYNVNAIDEFLLSAAQLTSFRKLVNENKNGLEKILDITSYESKYGSFIYQLKTSSNIYEINYKPLSIMTRIVEPLFSSLIGCYIRPVFFREGEMMGKIRCQNSGRTIKDLNLRYSFKFPEKIFTLRFNAEFDDFRGKKFAVPELKNSSENINHTDSAGSSTQGQYGGPRDGYGGTLDDDFINDVLDGDPDAYWNID